MLRVARIKLVDDSGPIQRLQVYEGSLGAYGGDRIIDKVPHVQHFGFASSAPIDAEVMLAAPAGDRTQTIALGTNHQPSRPRVLKTGDAMLYDVRGQQIWISADGIIIDGNGLGLQVTVRNVPKVRVEATQIECTGDVVANVDGTPISLVAMHAAYVAHKHTGVSTGSASTGLTDHSA